MSKRFKGRSAVACQICHAQKLKCSGGIPCQRCHDRGRNCVYPIKDRILAIPESYLRGLEAHANRAGGHVQDYEYVQTERVNSAPSSSSLVNEERIEVPRQLDDCSAERFVQKVKELSSLTTTSEPAQEQPEGPTLPSKCRYTYAELKFDCIRSDVSIKLPPRPYAFHLLQVFEEGFCDYHWFLRNKFRERLQLTYRDPRSQAEDRNWLCRVSAVLALAETWNRGRSHTSNQVDLILSGPNHVTGNIGEYASKQAVSNGAETTSTSPPGSELFEQSLLLLKLSSEEPTIEDVKALNLIAFHSYTLNRRKTAFFYARQSLSLAKLLSLDKPVALARTSEDLIQEEHRKRVWWTSYCMDRMASTDLGISAMQEVVPDGLRYPDSSQLSPYESSEFFEPYLLTAQVELSIIKSKVVETITQHLRLKDQVSAADALIPCKHLIQRWRDGLPAGLSFTFENGIPPSMLLLPFHRVLASLYLRYYQCAILLFRPILLQDLAVSIRQNTMHNQNEAPSPSAMQSNTALTAERLECLDAARSNCRILVDLWNISKIARFGYWESLHLFSGLAILSLSRILNLTSATNGDELSSQNGLRSDDVHLYSQGRDLLEDMASVADRC